MQTLVQPGWYPDGHGAMRWWDGVRWTEATQRRSGALTKAGLWVLLGGSFVIATLLLIALSPTFGVAICGFVLLVGAALLLGGKLRDRRTTPGQ